MQRARTAAQAHTDNIISSPPSNVPPRALSFAAHTGIHPSIHLAAHSTPYCYYIYVCLDVCVCVCYSAIRRRGRGGLPACDALEQTSIRSSRLPTGHSVPLIHE